MIRKRKALLIVLAAVCILCSVFAFGCASEKTYYTVTFMNGQTQVGEPLKVEKGKKITEYPTVTPETEYDYLDGWCMDKGLAKEWNKDVERVTKNVTLYAKFLRITEVPNNPSMENEAFSNTLTWLQRGVGSETAYSVELFTGEKVSKTDYDYNTTSPYYSESNCTVTVENYKGEADIYKVKWTAAQKPAGGVYAAKVSCGGEEVTFGELLYKGAGTEENPYLINDAADFAAISGANVPAGNYYKLLQSVVVRSASSKVAGFTFDGYLDGNGKTVTIEASDCGLFTTLGENAVVCDLNVDGSVPVVSENCAGIIAAVNNGNIAFCNVSATVTSDLGTIGTLEADGKGITGGAGGFVGVNNGKINNCAFSGTVQASVGAGGIAAVNYGEIKNCTNGGTLGAGNANETGSSTKKYSYMGGIVAINNGAISQSATTGSGKLLAQRSESGDSPNNYMGGIAALNSKGASITECWFDGIRVHGNKFVGGIAGENAGTISYCFAAGVYKSGSKLHSYVGGYSQVGGIAGGLSGEGKVENCFVTANVYAYGEGAYSIAQTSESCVYAGGNLDIKETATLAAPAGEGNISVEITEETRTEYATKSYTLELTEEQLAVLNGSAEEAKFSEPTVRLVCEGFSTVKEHTISVTVHGTEEKSYNIKNTSSGTVSLGKNNAPAAPNGQYMAGWALKEGGKVVLSPKATGYAELAELGLSSLNLYPVYAEGEDPDDKILSVAIWTRYVDEETVKTLLQAFENSAYFADCESVEYKVLTSGNNNGFATDFGKGDYNVGFAWKNANVNVGQTSTVTVYTYNVNSNAYDSLYVGFVGDMTANSAFKEFLATDRAKKILNPAYISESEAERIEITLLNGGTQYGEKLIVSNATDAKKLTLPAVTVDATHVFKGWETASGAILSGAVGYDDLLEYATEGKLTLTAKVEDKPAEQTVLIVGYWTYGDAVNSTVVSNLKTEFETYMQTAEGVKYKIEFREYSLADYPKVADLVDKIDADGDVDYILGIGKSSGNLNFVDGTKVQVGSRYVAQLTNNAEAAAFHTFIQNSTVLKAA